MKRMIALVICSLAVCQTIRPQWNCLDDNKHLKESFDTKTYGPPIGGCSCECDQEQARGLHSPNRDKCLQCNHYHDPAPQYVVAAQPKPQGANGIIHRHPLAALKALIAKYRQKNQYHLMRTGTR